MNKKIVYKKDDLLGDKPYGSDAMQDIISKDSKNVVNQPSEKKNFLHY